MSQQTIPFKGRNYLRERLTNKPHKWDFKVFSRNRAAGMVCEILILSVILTQVGNVRLKLKAAVVQA